MPDEIERELAAFGRTLEEETAEAIRPATDLRAEPDRRPTRRWWALAGAAACVMAVVAGLLVATRPPDDDPVAAPATTTTVVPTTTTSVPAPVVDLIPDDPLALQRDGWTFRQRDEAPFEIDADSFPVVCDEATRLEVFNGVDRVVDDFELGSVRLSVSIVDVGSLEAGNRLADGVLGLESCLARSSEGATVDTVALSSIRATWLQVGHEFALATIVGERNHAVLLEVEGGPFGEDLVAGLAHRADQFLRGQAIVGVPDDTLVATTTIVAREGPFVERGPSVGEPAVAPQPGEVQLWVSNQSFADDAVTVMVRVDGIPVVSEVFLVEGQHNWQSWLLRGLAPGEHTVTAESDTGVTTSWTFTLPGDEPRWLVLDYWNDADAAGRRFTFHASDQPIAFA